MLYLQRLQTHSIKIIIALVLLTATASQSNAQFFKGDLDERRYFFGITLGANNASFITTMHPRFLADDSVFVPEPGRSNGFHMGLSATARVFEHLQVRVNPQLMFFDRPIYYLLKYPDIYTRTDRGTRHVESVNLSFPVHAKFVSDKIGSFRFYALGGVKFDFDLASNADARKAEDLVKLQSSDYGVELGLGGSFYFKSFILSPEIKISRGLSNLHSRDANLIYSSVFDKIQSRMLVFSIHIEG